MVRAELSGGHRCDPCTTRPSQLLRRRSSGAVSWCTAHLPGHELQNHGAARVTGSNNVQPCWHASTQQARAVSRPATKPGALKQSKDFTQQATLQLRQSYQPHLRPFDWTDSSFCISNRISATSLSLSAAVPALHSNKQPVSTAADFVKTFYAKGESPHILRADDHVTAKQERHCQSSVPACCSSAYQAGRPVSAAEHGQQRRSPSCC